MAIHRLQLIPSNNKIKCQNRFNAFHAFKVHLKTQKTLSYESIININGTNGASFFIHLLVQDNNNRI